MCRLSESEEEAEEEEEEEEEDMTTLKGRTPQKSAERNIRERHTRVCAAGTFLAFPPGYTQRRKATRFLLRLEIWRSQVLLPAQGLEAEADRRENSTQDQPKMETK